MSLEDIKDKLISSKNMPKALLSLFLNGEISVTQQKLMFEFDISRFFPYPIINDIRELMLLMENINPCHSIREGINTDDFTGDKNLLPLKQLLVASFIEATYKQWEKDKTRAGVYEGYYMYLAWDDFTLVKEDIIDAMDYVIANADS